MSNNSGWKSKEAAEHYKKVINDLVPGRHEILDIISRVTTEFSNDEFKILDLGCGYGEVTAKILELKPNAKCYLVDYSEEMVNLSKERYKDNGNVKILRQDLNKGLPQELENEKFDAVVSCFSLHHIEFQNRVKLYADILNVLKKDSIFINGDMFICDSTKLNEWEFNHWIEWMVRRIKESLNTETTFDKLKQKQLDAFEKLGDKPGTLWEMYNDLKEAGFKNVDCLYKNQKNAIITAVK